jgi:ArsR family transcriptional regulator
MHYKLSKESCTICREVLHILEQHANELPEAKQDREVLATILKSKSDTCTA